MKNSFFFFFVFSEHVHGNSLLHTLVSDSDIENTEVPISQRMLLIVGMCDLIAVPQLKKLDLSNVVEQTYILRDRS